MKILYQVAQGCTCCLMCFYACKHGAITIEPGVSAKIDPGKCVGCGKCRLNCASEAIIKITEET